MRSGAVELSGARWVVSGLPRWLLLSPVAPMRAGRPRRRLIPPTRLWKPPGGLRTRRSAYPLTVLGRITIDAVRPTTPSGEFPAKAVVGERVPVSADIFRDGHDLLGGPGAVAARRAVQVALGAAAPGRQRPLGGHARARPRSAATRS